MDMCYDGALVMPSNYVVMDEEEMTYVEGGGTFYLTLKKNTICAAIGGLACFGTKLGLNALFSGMMLSIAVAIELGTAGWGTMFAGLLLCYGSKAAAGLAGIVAKRMAGNIYTGGDAKIEMISGFLIPSMNWKF